MKRILNCFCVLIFLLLCDNSSGSFLSKKYDDVHTREKRSNVAKSSPAKKNAPAEPDQGDKMDTAELEAEDREKAKPVIQHVPLPNRPESQNCECGFHLLVEKAETAVEGEEKPLPEYDQPWQVWITAIDASSKSYDVICGGTLINDRIILTQAKCVESFKDKPQDAEFLWEKRRINYKPGGSKSTEKAIKVAEVIIHPKYLESKVDHEVALIRLESPVDFTIENGVRPVCLPGTREHIRLGRDGVLSKLKLEDVTSDIGEKIPHLEDYNSLYSSYDCQRIYKSHNNETAKSYLCAGIRSDYTEKYFGAPLMVEMANTQLLQIAVLSSRFFPDRNVENTTANLFIRIGDLLPFIEENSEKANATWCNHAVMKFNDSAPISRIVGEAWLGTTSDERIEDPNCVCGYRNRVQQGRIVGGTETLPYEFPWQVLLTISMDDEPMLSSECGGTIINDKLVLTAAHCIFDQYKAYNPETAEQVPVTDAANVKVQILVHQASEDPRAKILDLAKIYIHPEYVEDFKLGYQDYDIAILELETPLSFWNSMGPLPVCLPSSFDTTRLEGQNATVIGWGLTDINDPDSGAATLQQLIVPIQPLAKCKELSALEVTDRFVCAGTFDPSHDTLHGDSGGPLHVEMSQDRLIQVGIVSWGDHERRKTEGLVTDMQAALYTNVSSPEVLSYIDYFSKKSNARWCKKSFFGKDPRRPWEGMINSRPTINPDCVCGTPDEDEPAENTTSEFPWTVLIIKLDRPGAVSYCSGTIINNLFVLTSAHCVRNKDPVTVHLKPTIKTRQIRVQLLKYESEAVNLRSSLRVADVYIHPDYLTLEGEGDDHFEFNIGLLRLERPLIFTKRRKQTPVCLPTTAETSDFLGKDRMLMGVKKTSTSKKKQVAIESLETTILEWEKKCGGKLNKMDGIDQKYFCAELTKQKENISIAEGGSLTSELPSGQILQIGIMSYFNPISYLKTSRRKYTRIQGSLPFIEHVSQEAKATWCQKSKKQKDKPKDQEKEKDKKNKKRKKSKNS